MRIRDILNSLIAKQTGNSAKTIAHSKVE
ncbi:hypothetical protein [Sulfurimonas sp. CS5]